MSGHRRIYNEEEEEYFDYDGYGGEEYNDYDDDAYYGNYEHEEGSLSSGDQLVDDAPAVLTPPIVDVTPLLCKTHGLTPAASECDHCNAVRALVTPDQMEQLKGSKDVAIPDPATRFGATKPTTKPTLVLDKSAMAFGKAVYTRGPMSLVQYKQVVKESLFISLEQNAELNKNQQLEPMLEKYLKEPRFKHVSNLVYMLVNMNKKNRVAQRPLLMAISEIDKMIRTLKSSGKEIGFSYPEVVPSVKVMSPSPVQDHTSYESADPFPLPDFTDIFDGVDIPPEQRKIIEDNMAINATVLSEYQSKVSSGVLGLYDVMSRIF